MPAAVIEALTPGERANEDPQPQRRAKVLYVGGMGRSGSTLLGRILGQAPGAICLGETRYLWERGLLHNVRCGCGAPFRECAFWSMVGEEAFGGWDRVELERIVAIDRHIFRLRRLPLHWLPSARPRFAAAIGEYASLLEQLYTAIVRVSGARTLVDTSKNPNFASLLARTAGVDARMIHLVRDSRAVAYSWTRSKENASPIGDQRLLAQFAPSSIGPKWLVFNGALRALALRGVPYAAVRYEDFVARPHDTLSSIAELAQEALVPPDTQLDGNSVQLGEHHMFSGNPMRASTGWIEIAIDDEWRTAMPSSEFAQVTAVTWPQLRHYGYPIVSRAPRG